jgi:uncharacterized protein YndB with AHSA1/START domain
MKQVSLKRRNRNDLGDKKMKTYEIYHEVGIKAAPEAIYQALTDPKKLAQWWTSDTRGESEVGSHLEFWFGELCQKFEVVTLKPNELVRWKGAKGGIDEWVGTEISFALESDEGQCWVRFIHSGWKDNKGILAHCSTKWAVFMLSLKDLLEKGKGHPVPNDWEVNHN